MSRGELSAAYKAFGDSVRPLRRMMDDIDLNAAAALANRGVLARHEAMQAASVVLLSGYLESFLRSAAQAFFDEIERIGITYADLPDEMKVVHFSSGGACLSKVADRVRKDKPSTFNDTLTVARAILHPVVTSSPKLYWRAFADTRSNPGPDVIRDYLKKFDIDDCFRELGTETGYGHLHIQSQLRTLIELRNECAHTGSMKTVPMPSAIRDYIDFLRRLTHGIVQLLKRKLANL